MVLDILRGLSYLHSRRIVHMDLKPGNVFLGTGGVAKIGDFGLSQLMAVDHVTKNEVIGTLSWAAPEMLLNTRVNEKVLRVALFCVHARLRPMAGDCWK